MIDRYVGKYRVVTYPEGMSISYDRMGQAIEMVEDRRVVVYLGSNIIEDRIERRRVPISSERLSMYAAACVSYADRTYSESQAWRALSERLSGPEAHA